MLKGCGPPESTAAGNGWELLTEATTVDCWVYWVALICPRRIHGSSAAVAEIGDRPPSSRRLA